MIVRHADTTGIGAACAWEYTFSNSVVKGHNFEGEGHVLFVILNSWHAKKEPDIWAFVMNLSFSRVRLELVVLYNVKNIKILLVRAGPN
jgi:hypothetical protein